MPGMSIMWPGMLMSIPACGSFASGTRSPRSRSHACISSMSSFCERMILRAKSATCSLAPWVGAQRAITTACAWCPIIPCMNRVSAAVCRSPPVCGAGAAAGAGALAGEWSGPPWHRRRRRRARARSQPP